MTIKNVMAIPQELRDLKYWLLWKYEDKGSAKPTKVPYTIAHNLASVTNPEDWCTFNEVYNAYQFGGYDGIGFVFDSSNPYCFIDLDDTNGDAEALKRQQLIFKSFNSYSELSPSGKGLHIIIKGAIPQGRRRSNVEIYSSQRYATMTGNVYNNSPIEDRNELVNQLFNQMGGKPNIAAHTGNAAEIQSDEQIIEQALNATNGDKFRELYSGDWNNFYQSQSEADFALIDIIAFYTQNRVQIARIFHSSKLGQRNKAKRRDYLEWMINKSFDKIPPDIDFDGFRIALEEKIAQNKGVLHNGSASGFGPEGDGSIPSTPTTNGPVAQRSEPVAHNGLVVGSNPTGTTIQPPPGLVGEIARFIYEAAPRPVPEIALAAAIGLMAGICGRAYNVSGTGLNQYVLLLANTGTGKESLASGIDKIINAVSERVPVASEFIGPSEIASGQALIKYLANKSQSFVSVLGEFGLRMQAMSDPRANGAEKSLKRMLLDLYNKSGHGQVARPSIYADVDKNTNLISSPAFSILGESTPETFYSALSEEMIAEGLLPRFMMIEYNGPRPALNTNHQIEPDGALIDRVSTVMGLVKTTMANRSIINVQIEPNAKAMLDEFDRFADSRINNTDKEIVRQLWNRAHVKLLKISAIVAVGCQPYNPVINVGNVLWAKQIVENDIRSLSIKFESGQIGRNTDEIKQVNDMKRMIAYYLKNDWDKVKAYAPSQQLHSEKIIPHVYLNKRLSSMASYKNDMRAKASVSINNVIKIMIDGGLLTEAPKSQMINKFNTAMRAFIVSDVNEFL